MRVEVEHVQKKLATWKEDKTHFYFQSLGNFHENKKKMLELQKKVRRSIELGEYLQSEIFTDQLLNIV